MKYKEHDLSRFKAEVLEKLPQGWTLRQIFAQPGMCAMSFFFAKVLPEDKAFKEQYARAMELRNEFWADEMVDIADDGSNDWMERELANGLTIDVVNQEVVQRSKLRIEARKWLMGKSQPKKYGEKVEVEHKSDPDAPPVFTLKIDNS